MSSLSAVIEQASIHKAYAFDVEYNPDTSIYDPGFRLCGLTLWSGNCGVYLRDQASIATAIQRMFSEASWIAIAHNAKSDLKALSLGGYLGAVDYPSQIFDTMVAENVLNDSLNEGQLGLKSIVMRRFEHRMMEFMDAWAFGPNSEEFEAYGLEDGKWEFTLYLKQRAELEAARLLKYVLAVPAHAAFADIEKFGHYWDCATARELGGKLRRLRDFMELEVYKAIGHLNLASPKQLSERLFQDMGIPTAGLKHSKKSGAVSTDADNLMTLAARYPEVAKIVNFRTAQKMLGTYLVPFTEMALADRDGRIHADYWLVSSTGRTRCSSPNLQNIPTNLDPVFGGLQIRSAMAARPGWKLVVCDLSQIELRLVAHFTKDPTLSAAYLNWKCSSCDSEGSSAVILHACPKCGVFENEDSMTGKVPGFWHGLDLHQITSDSIPVLRGNRKMGKVCNFALVYNATAYRMQAEHPSYTVEAWEQIIYHYFLKYPGVRAWHAAVEADMWRVGQARDIFGRCRRLSKEQIRAHTKHALNQLVNFGPQASACGIMQMCMTEIRKRLRAEGLWGTAALMVNMVHDELVLECRDDVAKHVKDVVVHTLENHIRISMPIRSSFGIAQRWSEAK